MEHNPEELEVIRDIKFKNVLHIYDQKFYNYYRKKRKARCPSLNNKRKWELACGALFKAAQELLIEKEGGVYLKKIGYFSMMMYPKKVRVNSISKVKKFKNYFPYFFGEGVFKNWTFDRAFSSSIHTLTKSKARKNKTYTVNYTILQKLLSAIKKIR